MPFCTCSKMKDDAKRLALPMRDVPAEAFDQSRMFAAYRNLFDLPEKHDRTQTRNSLGAEPLSGKIYEK